jgi:hypothetical protein
MDEKEIDVFINIMNKYKKFNNIPKEYLTKNICEYFLYRGEILLKDIPKEIKTKEFCLGLLEKEIKTKEFYPCNIRGKRIIIPEDVEEHMTSEIYSDLVKKGEIHANHVPKKFMNKEIALRIEDMKDISEEFFDDDFYLNYVKICPNNILKIPKEKQSLEMIKLFFIDYRSKIYPWFNYFCPNKELIEKLKYKFSYFCVKSDFAKMQIIPDKHKNYKLCLFALSESSKQRSNYLINHIPKKIFNFKTIYVCSKNNKFIKNYVNDLFYENDKVKKNLSYYYF